jgi:hypothetical protein
MPNLFYDLPIYFALFLIFLACNCLSLLGYAASHTFLTRVDNKDIVTKIVWQTILFFSSIFITFWIATNWSNLGTLKQTTTREANVIAQLYNDFEALDIKQRANLNKHLDDYLNLVVNDEYPHLARGEESRKTNEAYRSLVLSIYDYHPRALLAEELRYNRILTQLENLSDYREIRLDFLIGNLQGPLLFFFLIMISVGCFWTGFIDTKSRLFTLFIIMSQNLIISSSCWLILEMDKPFQGQLSVDKAAFISVWHARNEISHRSVPATK